MILLLNFFKEYQSDQSSVFVNTVVATEIKKFALYRLTWRIAYDSIKEPDLLFLLLSLGPEILLEANFSSFTFHT